MNIYVNILILYEFNILIKMIIYVRVDIVMIIIR